MSNPEHNKVEVESATDSGNISMAKKDWDRLWDEKKNLEDYLCIAEDALTKEKKKGAELRRDLDGVRREKWEVERQLKAVEQQLGVVEGNLKTSTEMVNSLQRKLDEQVAEGKEIRENVEAAHKMGKVHETHLKGAAKIMENLQKEVKVVENMNKELRTRLIQEQEENGKCQAKFGEFRDAVLRVRVEVTRFEASLGNGENQDGKETGDNTKSSAVEHLVEKKLKELEEIEMSLAEWVGLGEAKKMVLDICQIYNSSFGICTPKATDVACSTSTVVTMGSRSGLEAEFPLTCTSTDNTRDDSDCVDVGEPSNNSDSSKSSTTTEDKSEAVPSTSVTLAGGSKKGSRVSPKKRRYATDTDNHVVLHTFSMTGTSSSTGNTRGDSDFLDVCLSGPNEHRHSSTGTDADRREDIPFTSLTSAVRSKRQRKPPQKYRHLTLASGLPSFPNNHVQEHAKDRSERKRKGHYCVCGHKAKNWHGLRCHISYKTTEAKFSCSECSLRRVYMSELRHHLLQVHGIIDNRIGCRKCGGTFPNYKELQQHQMFSASCRVTRNYKEILRIDLTADISSPGAQMPVTDISYTETEQEDGSAAEVPPPTLRPYYV